MLSLMIAGLLLAISIPLVALARRFDIPYPIALVAGGLLLSVATGYVPAKVDPHVILFVFLPPLLYAEAISAPIDEMRRQAGWIAGLAFGLVLATAAAVAAVAVRLAPELDLAGAVLLGAIVAPTDPVAAAPVIARFGIARRILATLQGESLLNDALALVMYAIAFGVITSGTFARGEIAWDLALAFIGSPIVGLLVGYVASVAWRTIRDARLQMAISILVPFVAYLAADRLQMSGVVAVVVAGFYVNARSSRDMLPSTRVISTGFWETMVFLVNAVVFMLVGFALHVAWNTFRAHRDVLPAVAAVVAVVLLVRFAWVFGVGAAVRAAGKPVDWRGAFTIAWCGMRGGISAALAIALPTAIEDRLFVERDIIVTATFAVIFFTLIGEGLTLPWIIDRVKPEKVDPVAEGRDVLEGVSTPVSDRVIGISGDLVTSERKTFANLHGQGRIDDVVHARFEHAIDFIDAGRRALIEGDPFGD
jgi:CPA1 family monovalent cation:H+ antiporter